MRHIKIMDYGLPTFSMATRPFVPLILESNHCDLWLDSQAFHSLKNEKHCRFDELPKIINGEQKIMRLSPDLEAGILPVLIIDPKFSDYKIGDWFTSRGLSFLMVDHFSAMCNQIIGITPFYDAGYYSDDTFDIGLIMKEWFDTYFKNAIINKYPAIEVYDIVPMIDKKDRYCITNKQGLIRHNDRGYGFTSVEKATNFLFGYCDNNPIPQEDINAYLTK